MRPARAAGVAVAAVLLVLAPHATVAASDPACGTFPIVASATTDRYTLPHGFIRTGSDSLWTSHGPLRRGSDYVLDNLRGSLRMLATLTPGDTLWVSVCWLLVPPPLEYFRQRYRPLAGSEPALASPESAAVAPLLRPSTGRDITTAPGGAALSVTGNKTIAVEFGSQQDAALRQSLDLAVGGTLAPGVELTGVLSDRNTPLTAAGSTQDLQSLDRVLIELRAPHASAALGDIALTVHQGEFAQFARQVQGVQGEWHDGGFEGSVAAASEQGEYFRMQFPGTDGLQGPYQLTDRDGGTAITVVAGSEVVTVDGQRMARGESADYSVDYDRGRVTFTNRRPISSASRITVEYQYALEDYRRNLAAFSGDWHDAASRFWTSAITETDDKGRPLNTTLSSSDQQILAAAGDSASRALAAGLAPGPGDYDTLRVAGGELIVGFAGPDSGEFAASFAHVNPGLGEYADSAIVDGRTIYHWVGPNLGDYVLGRALPLPQSHQLVTVGGATRAGPLRVEAEGAFSRLDLNTASAVDDENDAGGAARVTATLEGGAGPLPGKVGLRASERDVSQRFAPFTRLERAFAEEDWGLPAGTDLDHERRADAGAYWQPAPGSELRTDLSRLVTPGGYAGWRRSAEWTGVGPTRSHLLVLDSEGALGGATFPEAGRRHWLGELAHTSRLFVPSLHVELDDRQTPGDSVLTRTRVQDVGGNLASGSALRWKLALGYDDRLDRQQLGAGLTGQRASTWSASGESPAGPSLGAAVSGQRRVARDLVLGTDTQSDLASVRLRAERRPWGLSGTIDVELTSEADNERERTLTYVGPGQGTYDEFGNFVGTGDYNLVLAVSPTLERYARVETSARSSWQFGSNEVWRGSRLDFTLEDEARRLGGPRVSDVFLSTGLALVDPQLARGAVLQRIEGDLAPGSHVAAFHLRAERRLTADRTFGNFAQTTDDRSGSLRWRARASAVVTLESQAQVQWERATEAIAGGAFYGRTLVDEGLTSQLVWQPGASLRVAGVLELDQSRPLPQPQSTRTIRIGPDASTSVGARGRAELSLRRAFVSGPPAVNLLPGVDPAGFARWDGNARFDLRLHETTTLGLTATVQERPDHATLVTGRAEVRAFF